MRMYAQPEIASMRHHNRRLDMYDVTFRVVPEQTLILHDRGIWILKASSGLIPQDASLLRCCSRLARYCTTSSLTLATPACTMPSARAAEYDTSTTRPCT
jgi:hypothetical protein